MTFKELNKKEFDEFAVNYIPNSPYQTSGYGDAMISEGYTVYYLGLVDNDVIKAATLVLVGTRGSFKYGYVPRGYLLDCRDKNILEYFTLEVRKFLNNKGVVAVKICPIVVKNIYDSNYNLQASNPDYDIIFNNFKMLNYRHLGYNNFFEALKPRHDGVIELNKDYFTLFKNMRKEFKTKVRSAENNGVRIYRGNFDDLKVLYEQSKNKYPRKFKYYEDLYNNSNDKAEIYYAKLDLDAFLKQNQNIFVEMEKEVNIINDEILKNKGKSHQKLLNKKITIDKKLNQAKAKLSYAINLMSKYPNGIILASVLIIKSNDTITVMLDSYDKKYTSFNAKHLIIWKLIEKYSKEGYHLFNLGGMVSNVDNTNKYYGLNNYKLGFGSKVYEYLGDLELVTNKPLYLLYKNSLKPFKKANQK